MTDSTVKIALSGVATLAATTMTKNTSLTNSYYYDYTCSSGNGTITYKINGSDAINNPASEISGTWILDNTAPVISTSISPNKTYFSPGETVTVTATITEANLLNGNPIFTLTKSSNVFAGNFISGSSYIITNLGTETSLSEKQRLWNYTAGTYEVTGYYSLFLATISGFTMSTFASGSTTITVGQTLQGAGIIDGTYIVSGSGSTWTISQSHSISSAIVISGYYTRTVGSTFVADNNGSYSVGATVVEETSQKYFGQDPPSSTLSYSSLSGSTYTYTTSFVVPVASGALSSTITTKDFAGNNTSYSGLISANTGLVISQAGSIIWF
jgi:hypothetical protein